MKNPGRLGLFLTLLTFAGCLESNPQPSPEKGMDGAAPPGGADVTEWAADAAAADIALADDAGVADLMAKEAVDVSPDAVDAVDQVDGGVEFDVEAPACVPCEPDCEGKVCGYNGCGGVCGTCKTEQLQVCEGEGQCYMADPPYCGKKMCGPDGLGGSCGFCPEGWFCEMGACKPDAGGCEGIPAGGVCISGTLFTCAGGEPAYDYCPYHQCITNEDTTEAACAEVPCLADCFGRTCGDDGCGGSCGECGEGETCHPDHRVCVPAAGCGDIAEDGVCLGHIFAHCDADALAFEPCLPEGKVCSLSGCNGPPGCGWAVPGTVPCGNLPEWGQCDDGHLFTCADGHLAVKHCTWLHAPHCQRVGLEKYGCAW